MKQLIALAITLLNASFVFASPAQLRWRGEISIWTRSLSCPDTHPLCVVPKKVAPPLPVDLLLREPDQEGRTVVAKSDFSHGEWKVELLIVWVKPEDRSTPYLVTQSRLRSAKRGLISECSRYDGLRSFTFLPPGSCSGRVGQEMFGFSFIAPTARP